MGPCCACATVKVTLTCSCDTKHDTEDLLWLANMPAIKLESSPAHGQGSDSQGVWSRERTLTARARYALDLYQGGAMPSKGTGKQLHRVHTTTWCTCSVFSTAVSIMPSSKLLVSAAAMARLTYHGRKQQQAVAPGVR